MKIKSKNHPNGFTKFVQISTSVLHINTNGSTDDWDRNVYALDGDGDVYKYYDNDEKDIHGWKKLVMEIVEEIDD